MPKRQTDDIQLLPKGRVEVAGLSLTDALAQNMATAIKKDNLVAGVMLPPLRKLAERHEVGLITVKRAIEKLVQAGVVESLPRIGYRISSDTNVIVKKIGIIYRDMHFHQGSSRSIDSIEKSVRLHNQVLMIGASYGNTKDEDECIKRFRMAGMDGLIIAPAFSGKKSIELERWIQDGLPTVLEGHAGPWKLSKKVSAMCPQIDFDNKMGVVLMLEYLWSLGHKNILLVSNDTNPHSVRKKTFEVFMKEKGQKFVCLERSETDFVEEIIRKLNRSGNKISAIFCMNDDLALGLHGKINGMKSKKLKGISVAGFGNQPSRAIETGVKLTTINYCLDELASKISLLMNGQFEKNQTVEKQVLIAPRLVIGNTCQPQ